MISATLYWIFEVLKVAVTFLLGYVALKIAARQAWTAHHGLKLDLFDRRLAIYDAIKPLLREGVKGNEIDMEVVRAFQHNTANAIFLFGPDVVDYLNRLSHVVIDRRAKLEMAAYEKDLNEKAKLMHAETEAMGWLANQYAEAQHIFAPYLDFQHIKGSDLGSRPVTLTSTVKTIGQAIRAVFR